MDDLAGNILCEKIKPPKEVEPEKKKSKKRIKTADSDVITEISCPEAKKVKLHTTEVAIEQDEISFLSRKQQCELLNMFCIESPSQDLDVDSQQQYTPLGYKNFAKCQLTEIPENTNVLSQFVTNFFPNWNEEKTAITQNGSPLLLLISSSAVRSLEMAREARQALGEDCTVAKLFAKHMKVDKQIAFLSTRICHIATGTPERLLQVINKFDYLTPSLKLVILDWQRKDAKQRSITEISENQKPLATLLREFIIPFLLSCQTKIFLL